MSRVVEFYNEYHLGDNVFHLTFLRKLSRLVDDHFVYYVRPEYLPELSKHIVGFADRIELDSLENKTSTAVNAWIGEIYYQHPDKFLFDKFYIDWFNYLTTKIYGKKFDIDMISDYAPLSDAMPRIDMLIINSMPFSGQFDYQEQMLNSTIQDLNKVYSIMTTKKVEGVRCTTDYYMSLVDIGTLAANCDYIAAVNTGPISASLNKWAVENVKAWIIGANNHSYSFSNLVHTKNTAEFCAALNKIYL